MLVCAMNPCPCGFYGHPTKSCSCSPKSKNTYLGRVSGPVLDRIDIQVEVGALEFDDLHSAVACETSEQIRARVTKARAFALERFDGIRLRNGSPLTANALMEPQHLELFCRLDEDAKELIRRAFDKLSLSARGYNRLLKVARTIADFEECQQIGKQHVATAIRMRSLDRKYFGSI
jgi:magnesium chelatase family protein